MKSVKDLFKRYYTSELAASEGKTVYDLFKWKTVDVFLKDNKS